MKLDIAGDQILRLVIAGAFSLVLLARAELPHTTPGFAVQTWGDGAEDPANYNYPSPIVQTPDGYLWIGTPNGLTRFDGIRLVTLTTNDTPALGDNRISSLFVDEQGVLWAGTRGGTLSRREARAFSSVPMDKRLRGHPIESLGSAEEGELWLGTATRAMPKRVPRRLPGSWSIRTASVS